MKFNSKSSLFRQSRAEQSGAERSRARGAAAAQSINWKQAAALLVGNADGGHQEMEGEKEGRREEREREQARVALVIIRSKG